MNLGDLFLQHAYNKLIISASHFNINAVMTERPILLVVIALLFVWKICFTQSASFPNYLLAFIMLSADLIQIASVCFPSKKVA